MAKRYGELADALDELALHARLDNELSMSNHYRTAASALRLMESMPMDPAEADGISTEVRDEIAEWRSRGEIDKLEQKREERPYMSSLTRIASVGPKTAKLLHEQHDIDTISDVREMSDDLETVDGIGPKTATTIRRSIAQLNE
jgi:DNA polymerase/3'-5' exonuclease PolX